jgi:uncharacterized membrane protein (DUF4010 family)
MDITSLAFTLLVGLGLGAVIGLEREVNEKSKHDQDPTLKPIAIVGLRSFSLITILGVITGFLYPVFSGLSIVIASVFFLLLLIFYILHTHQTKDTGITTELAMVFSFVIGVLLSIPSFPIQLTIAIAIIVTLLLSQKRKIKDAVEEIKSHEINAFISFAIIALVVLPFLPNTAYALSDLPGLTTFFQNIGLQDAGILNIELVNPFKLWLIVVLVIGVDLIGYVLERVIGSKKGWLLASAAGGFVSSTATTQSLAQESKHRHRINPLLSAAILANIVSFIQVAILIALINGLFLVKLLPVLGLMLAAGVGVLLYFVFLDREDNKAIDQKEVHKKENEKIIDIGAALKFAALFLVISIFSKITLELFGNNGFFIATGIGSLIGLDAVMINTATLAGNQIDYRVAAFGFILANAVNLFGKSFYSFAMGKKEFAVKFLISMIVIVAASLLGVFFI